jgi:hypothetical protein
MKLRLALGIGALALLIVGMVAWGGSMQRSVDGTIVAVGAAGLPLFAPAADDLGGLVLCTPEGDWPSRSRAQNGAVFVHVLPFTRVLDARGRLLASAARFESLAAGQRIRVWTTDETVQTWPPQVYAVKIEIAGGPEPGGDPAACRWQTSDAP